MQQCHPFDVPIHLDQRVMDLTQRDDGRWTVRTQQGMVFDVAAILLAAGNGAFLPQRLMLPEAAALEEAPCVLQRRAARRFRRQERGRRGRRRLRARLGARASQRGEAPDAGASSQWFQRDRFVGRQHEARGRGRRDGLRRRHDRAGSMRRKAAALGVDQARRGHERARRRHARRALWSRRGSRADRELGTRFRAGASKSIRRTTSRRGRASSRSAISPTIRTSRS